MVRNYEEWKAKQNQDDNPDLKCLSDLLYVVKQYLDSPESLARIGNGQIPSVAALAFKTLSGINEEAIHGLSQN